MSEKEQHIAVEILKEINARLGFIVEVGLTYLTLHRSAKTLSGGEAQRIRLATQIGSELMNVLYVLDEPSIGLHQRDNSRLIKSLQRLRDTGNSVIVVEHDKEMIEAADFVVEVRFKGKSISDVLEMTIADAAFGGRSATHQIVF